MNYLRILLLSFFVVFSVHASATKCASIDSEKIFNNSKVYKDFKLSWDHEKDKNQKEIEFYESQIMKFDKLSTSNSNLSPQEKEKLKKQIGHHEIKIQELLQKSKTHMDKSYSATMLKLQTKLQQVVQRYVVQHGIELVIDKSQTVYVSESVDITDAIINILNKNLE